MNKTFYFALAFVVGFIIALHLAMNADVGEKIENARAANAVFWTIGAVVAIIIWLASPNRGAITRLKDVNPLLLLAGAMGAALVLAIVFIYMILASQFKSFVQPLALMTALPLTLIGVVLALMFFGSALSMFSVIGIVMLMGLVTKNAILLVDFAIRARQDSVAPDGSRVAGLSRDEALLMAARVRLRPILMTTLAMVFGMLPLAFALTEGSEMRAPMGQAVIGGVITSSLLTLVVVPVAYGYMDDLAQWTLRLLGVKSHDAQAPKIDRPT